MIIQHLDRDVLQPLAAHQHDDRHLEAAPAHQVDQRRRLALQALLAPIDHHAADRGIGLDRNLGVLDRAAPGSPGSRFLDRAGDLVQPMPSRSSASKAGAQTRKVKRLKKSIDYPDFFAEAPLTVFNARRKIPDRAPRSNCIGCVCPLVDRRDVELPPGQGHARSPACTRVSGSTIGSCGTF